MTCRGCVHQKKSAGEWPCNECVRINTFSHHQDMYELPGDKIRLSVTKASGKYKLVDKGGHWVTEEV